MREIEVRDFMEVGREFQKGKGVRVRRGSTKDWLKVQV